MIADAILAGKLSQSRLAAFVLNNQHVDLGFLGPFRLRTNLLIVLPAAYDKLPLGPTVLNWAVNLFEENPLSYISELK